MQGKGKTGRREGGGWEATGGGWISDNGVCRILSPQQQHPWPLSLLICAPVQAQGDPLWSRMLTEIYWRFKFPFPSKADWLPPFYWIQHARFYTIVPPGKGGRKLHVTTPFISKVFCSGKVWALCVCGNNAYETGNWNWLVPCSSDWTAPFGQNSFHSYWFKEHCNKSVLKESALWEVLLYS